MKNKKQKQIADKIIELIKEKYGSINNFAKTIGKPQAEVYVTLYYKNNKVETLDYYLGFLGKEVTLKISNKKVDN